NTPVSAVVDKNGKLYFMDAGDNRIFRYPKPFQQTGDLLLVDLVIRQRTGASRNQPKQGPAQPKAKTTSPEPGESVFTGAMAFDPQGNLWMTDALNNRVLRFPVSSLAANVLDPAADLVLGQSTFTTNIVAPDPEGVTTVKNKNVIDIPAGLAFDQSG